MLRYKYYLLQLVILISAFTFYSCGSTDGELKAALDDGAVASNAESLVDSNNPPIADAGNNQRVIPGSSVKLNGSGSSDPDGDELTYLWAFTDTPEGSTVLFTEAAAADPSFTAGLPGIYKIRLTVNDGRLSGTDTVIITISNAPIANAGKNQVVTLLDEVTLNGSLSSDPNGDDLSFEWAFLSLPEGSAAVLSDATIVAPVFTADTAGIYEISLTVNDGKESSSDIIRITVNTFPVANAGDNRNAALDTELTLSGDSSYDPDGNTLSYSWTFISRPLESTAEFNDPTSVAPVFTPDKLGVFEIQLKVSDGHASHTDDLTITVYTPPVADAGGDRLVILPTLVTLDGSNSTDPEGRIIVYSWAFTALPIGSLPILNGPATATPNFTADAAGEYIIRLTVNNGLVSDTDTVSIIVNTPPIADAGEDQVVNLNHEVKLNGTGSSDPDDNPLDYLWAFVTLPPGSAAELINPTTSEPSFTADITGEYSIKLTVSDINASGEDQVSIRVNVPPVANAGETKTIPLNSPVGLDGSGSSDVDNVQLNYYWTIRTIPADSNPEIQNSNTVNPIFKADRAGIYTIELEAFDEYGASSIDTIELFASGLPDTGQITCYDDTGVEIDPCPGEGADHFGQDASYSVNQMSYTKLDENGRDLPFYASSWTMVRDDVTGLFWEVKTDNGSIHDRNNTYTWYNSDPATNGGNAGPKGEPGTNTEDFISKLNNAAGFGGYTDWRMPTDTELQSIVNYGQTNPSIDQDYFPGTISDSYWSSVTKNDNPVLAWRVKFHYGSVDFSNYDKSALLYVRAVRGTP